MKIMKKLMTVALCLAFAAGFMLASGLSAQKAYAEGSGYKYTVKIYSGKEGYFGDSESDANRVRSFEASYGDLVSINLVSGEIKVNGNTVSDVKADLTVSDSQKYYVKGIKVAGHDNGEVDHPAFTVKGDASYSVVYGMAGGMVKYVVNYVDESGNALAESEEFYGMIGDKPVVAFRHIEGYTPQAYNLGKTLTGDPTEDVFTFTYAEGGGTVIIDNGGANGGAAGGAAGDAGTNIGEGDTPAAGPADYVDLDDNQTPTTDAADIEDDNKPGANWALIGGGAILVAAIAALAVVFARRRREQEE